MKNSNQHPLKSKNIKPHYCENEMVYDCMRSDIIVFDINAMNIYTHDRVTKRIQSEFPDYFKQLVGLFMTQRVWPGDIIVRYFNGYTLCGILNQTNPADKYADDSDTVEYLTIKGIEKMREEFGDGHHYVSGLLMRGHHKNWPAVHNYIKENGLDWSVYYR